MKDNYISTLILEPDAYSVEALSIYEKLGPVYLGNAPVGALVSILVVRLGHLIEKALIESYNGLLAIASPTTGLNHIDLEVCNSKGIRVFSLSDCRPAIDSISSTSELTLGLIIALLRNIPNAVNDVVRHAKWERDKFRSRQMSNLTLGIVGLGRIGGHVARYAAALGMKVLACDPYQPTARFEQLGVERCGLHDLLQRSDIVTIHANLTADNHNLIGHSEVLLMRPDTLLVNTARGELVDEQAIAKALRERLLGGFAGDVLAQEQASPDWLSTSPLLRVAREGVNVLLTPHMGGCTSDAMHYTEECLARIVYEHLAQ
jgi:D-3-phosphoglycerate dehydrogenase